MDGWPWPSSPSGGALMCDEGNPANVKRALARISTLAVGSKGRAWVWTWIWVKVMSKKRCLFQPLRPTGVLGSYERQRGWEGPGRVGATSMLPHVPVVTVTPDELFLLHVMSWSCIGGEEETRTVSSASQALAGSQALRSRLRHLSPTHSDSRFDFSAPLILRRCELDESITSTQVTSGSCADLTRGPTIDSAMAAAWCQTSSTSTSSKQRVRLPFNIIACPLDN
jgi:hypothetical protein